MHNTDEKKYIIGSWYYLGGVLGFVHALYALFVFGKGHFALSVIGGGLIVGFVSDLIKKLVNG